MYSAAGILPIAHKQDQLMVLLGSEPSSTGLVWLGFGGKKEAADQNDPEATALRETREEMGDHWLSRAVVLMPIRFFDFRAKYMLYLAWVPYTEELPSFTDEQAAAQPTLNKRQLAWFPLDSLLNDKEFELDGAYPIKPWFYQMLQRERYAIRRACGP